MAKLQCLSERRRSKLADILLRVGLGDGGAGEGVECTLGLRHGVKGVVAVKKFNDVPLRTIGLFELQTVLNDLAETYAESIVKHAFVNLRSIMKLAQKLKFIPENPGEETKMPATKAVERPTMTPEQISSLMGAIEDPHDLCLMCIGLFCATRTSETLGLQWKSYLGDKLSIHSTAYEGELYRGQVKTCNSDSG